MNNWRETIEQSKPRPQRTRPCANKQWKRAAKAFWRSLVSSEKHLHCAVSDFCTMCNLEDEAHSSIALICPKDTELGDFVDTFKLLMKDIAPLFIYGLNKPTYDTSIPKWWHPPTKWDWRWKIYNGRVARLFTPLDPARLP